MNIDSKIREIAARGIKPVHNEVADVLDSKGTRSSKYIMLVAIADRVMPGVLPSTPCRNGCSYCCNTAAAIGQHEASLIEAFTGMKAKTLNGDIGDSYHRLSGNVMKYYGVPCTFLKDNTCTIYEVRPMTCRVHHSLNETNAECEPTPGECDKPVVPQLNLESLRMGVASLDLDRSFGDIRDYFPKETT